MDSSFNPLEGEDEVNDETIEFGIQPPTRSLSEFQRFLNESNEGLMNLFNIVEEHSTLRRNYLPLNLLNLDNVEEMEVADLRRLMNTHQNNINNNNNNNNNNNIASDDRRANILFVQQPTSATNASVNDEILRNIDNIDNINNIVFDNEYNPVTSVNSNSNNNNSNTRENINTNVANGIAIRMSSPQNNSAFFTGMETNNYTGNNHKRGLVELYVTSTVASFDVLRDYYLMLCHPELRVYQVGLIIQQMVSDKVFFGAIDNIPLPLFATTFMNVCSVWWLYYPLRMLTKERLTQEPGAFVLASNNINSTTIATTYSNGNNSCVNKNGNKALLPSLPAHTHHSEQTTEHFISYEEMCKCLESMLILHVSFSHPYRGAMKRSQELLPNYGPRLMMCGNPKIIYLSLLLNSISNINFSCVKNMSLLRILAEGWGGQLHLHHILSWYYEEYKYAKAQLNQRRHRKNVSNQKGKEFYSEPDDSNSRLDHEAKEEKLKTEEHIHDDGGNKHNEESHAGQVESSSNNNNCNTANTTDNTWVQTLNKLFCKLPQDHETSDTENSQKGNNVPIDFIVHLCVSNMERALLDADHEACLWWARCRLICFKLLNDTERCVLLEGNSLLFFAELWQCSEIVAQILGDNDNDNDINEYEIHETNKDRNEHTESETLDNRDKCKNTEKEEQQYYEQDKKRVKEMYANMIGTIADLASMWRFIWSCKTRANHRTFINTTTSTTTHTTSTNTETNTETNYDHSGLAFMPNNNMNPTSLSERIIFSSNENNTDINNNNNNYYDNINNVNVARRLTLNRISIASLLHAPSTNIFWTHINEHVCHQPRFYRSSFANYEEYWQFALLVDEHVTQLHQEEHHRLFNENGFTISSASPSMFVHGNEYHGLLDSNTNSNNNNNNIIEENADGNVDADGEHATYQYAENVFMTEEEPSSPERLTQLQQQHQESVTFAITPLIELLEHDPLYHAELIIKTLVFHPKKQILRDALEHGLLEAMIKCFRELLPPIPSLQTELTPKPDNDHVKNTDDTNNRKNFKESITENDISDIIIKNDSNDIKQQEEEESTLDIVANNTFTEVRRELPKLLKEKQKAKRDLQEQEVEEDENLNIGTMRRTSNEQEEYVNDEEYDRNEETMPLLSVSSYRTLLIILDALIDCVEQSIQPPVNVVSLLLIPLSQTSPVSLSTNQEHHHFDSDYENNGGESEQSTNNKVQAAESTWPDHHGGVELAVLLHFLIKQTRYCALSAAAMHFMAVCIHSNVRDMVPALVERGLLSTVLTIASTPLITCHNDIKAKIMGDDDCFENIEKLKLNKELNNNINDDVSIESSKLCRTKVLPMEHLTQVCLRCDVHAKNNTHCHQSNCVTPTPFNSSHAHNTMTLLIPKEESKCKHYENELEVCVVRDGCATMWFKQMMLPSLIQALTVHNTTHSTFQSALTSIHSPCIQKYPSHESFWETSYSVRFDEAAYLFDEPEQLSRMDVMRERRRNHNNNNNNNNNNINYISSSSSASINRICAAMEESCESLRMVAKAGSSNLNSNTTASITVNADTYNIENIGSDDKDTITSSADNANTLDTSSNDNNSNNEKTSSGTEIRKFRLFTQNTSKANEHSSMRMEYKALHIPWIYGLLHALEKLPLCGLLERQPVNNTLCKQYNKESSQLYNTTFASLLDCTKMSPNVVSQLAWMESKYYEHMEKSQVELLTRSLRDLLATIQAMPQLMEYFYEAVLCFAIKLLQEMKTFHVRIWQEQEKLNTRGHMELSSYVAMRYVISAEAAALTSTFCNLIRLVTMVEVTFAKLRRWNEREGGGNNNNNNNNESSMAQSRNLLYNISSQLCKTVIPCITSHLSYILYIPILYSKLNVKLLAGMDSKTSNGEININNFHDKRFTSIVINDTKDNEESEKVTLNMQAANNRYAAYNDAITELEDNKEIIVIPANITKSNKSKETNALVEEHHEFNVTSTFPELAAASARLNVQALQEFISQVSQRKLSDFFDELCKFTPFAENSIVTKHFSIKPLQEHNQQWEQEKLRASNIGENVICFVDPILRAVCFTENEMERTQFKSRYGMAMLLLLENLKSQKEKSMRCKLHEYATKFIASRKKIVNANTIAHVATTEIESSINLDTNTSNTETSGTITASHLKNEEQSTSLHELSNSHPEANLNVCNNILEHEQHEQQQQYEGDETKCHPNHLISDMLMNELQDIFLRRNSIRSSSSNNSVAHATQLSIFTGNNNANSNNNTNAFTQTNSDNVMELAQRYLQFSFDDKLRVDFSFCDSLEVLEMTMNYLNGVCESMERVIRRTRVDLNKLQQQLLHCSENDIKLNHNNNVNHFKEINEHIQEHDTPSVSTTLFDRLKLYWLLNAVDIDELITAERFLLCLSNNTRRHARSISSLLPSNSFCENIICCVQKVEKMALLFTSQEIDFERDIAADPAAFPPLSLFSDGEESVIHTDDKSEKVEHDNTIKGAFNLTGVQGTREHRSVVELSFRFHLIRTIITNMIRSLTSLLSVYVQREKSTNQKTLRFRCSVICLLYHTIHHYCPSLHLPFELYWSTLQQFPFLLRSIATNTSLLNSSDYIMNAKNKINVSVRDKTMTTTTTTTTNNDDTKATRSDTEVVRTIGNSSLKAVDLSFSKKKAIDNQVENSKIIGMKLDGDRMKLLWWRFCKVYDIYRQLRGEEDETIIENPVEKLNFVTVVARMDMFLQNSTVLERRMMPTELHHTHFASHHFKPLNWRERLAECLSGTYTVENIVCEEWETYDRGWINDEYNRESKELERKYAKILGQGMDHDNDIQSDSEINHIICHSMFEEFIKIIHKGKKRQQLYERNLEQSEGVDSNESAALRERQERENELELRVLNLVKLEMIIDMFDEILGQKSIALQELDATVLSSHNKSFVNVIHLNQTPREQLQQYAISGNLEVFNSPLDVWPVFVEHVEYNQYGDDKIQQIQHHVTSWMIEWIAKNITLSENSLQIVSNPHVPTRELRRYVCSILWTMWTLSEAKDKHHEEKTKLSQKQLLSTIEWEREKYKEAEEQQRQVTLHLTFSPIAELFSAFMRSPTTHYKLLEYLAVLLSQRETMLLMEIIADSLLPYAVVTQIQKSLSELDDKITECKDLHKKWEAISEHADSNNTDKGINTEIQKLQFIRKEMLAQMYNFLFVFTRRKSSWNTFCKWMSDVNLVDYNGLNNFGGNANHHRNGYGRGNLGMFSSRLLDNRNLGICQSYNNPHECCYDGNYCRLAHVDLTLSPTGAMHANRTAYLEQLLSDGDGGAGRMRPHQHTPNNFDSNNNNGSCSFVPLESMHERNQHNTCRNASLPNSFDFAESQVDSVSSHMNVEELRHAYQRRNSTLPLRQRCDVERLLGVLEKYGYVATKLAVSTNKAWRSTSRDVLPAKRNDLAKSEKENTIHRLIKRNINNNISDQVIHALPMVSIHSSHPESRHSVADRIIEQNLNIQDPNVNVNTESNSEAEEPIRLSTEEIDTDSNVDQRTADLHSARSPSLTSTEAATLLNITEPSPQEQELEEEHLLEEEEEEVNEEDDDDNLVLPLSASHIHTNRTVPSPPPLIFENATTVNDTHHEISNSNITNENINNSNTTTDNVINPVPSSSSTGLSNAHSALHSQFETAANMITSVNESDHNDASSTSNWMRNFVNYINENHDDDDVDDDNGAGHINHKNRKINGLEDKYEWHFTVPEPVLRSQDGFEKYSSLYILSHPVCSLLSKKVAHEVLKIALHELINNTNTDNHINVLSYNDDINNNNDTIKKPYETGNAEIDVKVSAQGRSLPQLTVMLLEKLLSSFPDLLDVVQTWIPNQTALEQVCMYVLQNNVYDYCPSHANALLYELMRANAFQEIGIEHIYAQVSQLINLLKRKHRSALLTDTSYAKLMNQNNDDAVDQKNVIVEVNETKPILESAIHVANNHSVNDNKSKFVSSNGIKKESNSLSNQDKQSKLANSELEAHHYITPLAACLTLLEKCQCKMSNETYMFLQKYVRVCWIHNTEDKMENAWVGLWLRPFKPIKKKIKSNCIMNGVNKKSSTFVNNSTIFGNKEEKEKKQEKRSEEQEQLWTDQNAIQTVELFMTFALRAMLAKQLKASHVCELINHWTLLPLMNRYIMRHKLHIPLLTEVEPLIHYLTSCMHMARHHVHTQGGCNSSRRENVKIEYSVYHSALQTLHTLPSFVMVALYFVDEPMNLPSSLFMLFAHRDLYHFVKQLTLSLKSLVSVMEKWEEDKKSSITPTLQENETNTTIIFNENVNSANHVTEKEEKEKEEEHKDEKAKDVKPIKQEQIASRDKIKKTCTREMRRVICVILRVIHKCLVIAEQEASKTYQTNASGPHNRRNTINPSGTNIYTLERYDNGPAAAAAAAGNYSTNPTELSTPSSSQLAQLFASCDLLEVLYSIARCECLETEWDKTILLLLLHRMYTIPTANKLRQIRKYNIVNSTHNNKRHSNNSFIDKERSNTHITSGNRSSEVEHELEEPEEHISSEQHTRQVDEVQSSIISSKSESDDIVNHTNTVNTSNMSSDNVTGNATHEEDHDDTFMYEVNEVESHLDQLCSSLDHINHHIHNAEEVSERVTGTLNEGTSTVHVETNNLEPEENEEEEENEQRHVLRRWRRRGAMEMSSTAELYLSSSNHDILNNITTTTTTPPLNNPIINEINEEDNEDDESESEVQIDYNVSFVNESNNNDNNHGDENSSNSGSSSSTIRYNMNIHSFNPLGHGATEEEMRAFMQYQEDVAMSAIDGEEEEEEEEEETDDEINIDNEEDDMDGDDNEDEEDDNEEEEMSHMVDWDAFPSYREAWEDNQQFITPRPESASPIRIHSTRPIVPPSGQRRRHRTTFTMLPHEESLPFSSSESSHSSSSSELDLQYWEQFAQSYGEDEEERVDEAMRNWERYDVQLNRNVNETQLRNLILHDQLNSTYSRFDRVSLNGSNNHHNNHHHDNSDIDNASSSSSNNSSDDRSEYRNRNNHLVQDRVQRRINELPTQMASVLMNPNHRVSNQVNHLLDNHWAQRGTVNASTNTGNLINHSNINNANDNTELQNIHHNHHNHESYHRHSRGHHLRNSRYASEMQRFVIEYQLAQERELRQDRTTYTTSPSPSPSPSSAITPSIIINTKQKANIYASAPPLLTSTSSSFMYLLFRELVVELGPMTRHNTVEVTPPPVQYITRPPLDEHTRQKEETPTTTNGSVSKAVEPAIVRLMTNSRNNDHDLLSTPTHNRLIHSHNNVVNDDENNEAEQQSPVTNTNTSDMLFTQDSHEHSEEEEENEVNQDNNNDNDNMERAESRITHEEYQQHSRNSWETVSNNDHTDLIDTVIDTNNHVSDNTNRDANRNNNSSSVDSIIIAAAAADDEEHANQMERSASHPWQAIIDPEFLTELPSPLWSEIVRDNMAILQHGITTPHNRLGRMTFMDLTFLDQFPEEIQVEMLETEQRWNEIHRINQNTHTNANSNAIPTESAALVSTEAQEANAATGMPDLETWWQERQQHYQQQEQHEEEQQDEQENASSMPEAVLMLLTVDDPEIRNDILRSCSLRDLQHFPALLAEASFIRSRDRALQTRQLTREETPTRFVEQIEERQQLQEEEEEEEEIAEMLDQPSHTHIVPEMTTLSHEANAEEFSHLPFSTGNEMDNDNHNTENENHFNSPPVSTLLSPGPIETHTPTNVDSSFLHEANSPSVENAEENHHNEDENNNNTNNTNNNVEEYTTIVNTLREFMERHRNHAALVETHQRELRERLEQQQEQQQEQEQQQNNFNRAVEDVTSHTQEEPHGNRYHRRFPPLNSPHRWDRHDEQTIIAPEKPKQVICKLNVPPRKRWKPNYLPTFTPIMKYKNEEGTEETWKAKSTSNVHRASSNAGNSNVINNDITNNVSADIIVKRIPRESRTDSTSNVNSYRITTSVTSYSQEQPPSLRLNNDNDTYENDISVPSLRVPALQSLQRSQGNTTEAEHAHHEPTQEEQQHHSEQHMQNENELIGGRQSLEGECKEHISHTGQEEDTTIAVTSDQVNTNAPKINSESNNNDDKETVKKVEMPPITTIITKNNVSAEDVLYNYLHAGQLQLLIKLLSRCAWLNYVHETQSRKKHYTRHHSHRLYSNKPVQQEVQEEMGARHLEETTSTHVAESIEPQEVHISDVLLQGVQSNVNNNNNEIVDNKVCNVNIVYSPSSPYISNPPSFPNNIIHHCIHLIYDTIHSAHSITTKLSSPERLDPPNAIGSNRTMPHSYLSYVATANVPWASASFTQNNNNSNSNNVIMEEVIKSAPLTLKGTQVTLVKQTTKLFTAVGYTYDGAINVIEELFKMMEMQLAIVERFNTQELKNRSGTVLEDVKNINTTIYNTIHTSEKIKHTVENEDVMSDSHNITYYRTAISFICTALEMIIELVKDCTMIESLFVLLPDDATCSANMKSIDTPISVKERLLLESRFASRLVRIVTGVVFVPQAQAQLCKLLRMICQHIHARITIHKCTNSSPSDANNTQTNIVTPNALPPIHRYHNTNMNMNTTTGITLSFDNPAPAPVGAPNLESITNSVQHIRHSNPLLWRNLSSEPVYRFGVICNICGTSIPHSYCYHCNRCTFDMCRFCIKEQLTAQEQRTRIRRTMYYRMHHEVKFVELVLELMRSGYCTSSLASLLSLWIGCGLKDCALLDKSQTRMTTTTNNNNNANVSNDLTRLEKTAEKEEIEEEENNNIEREAKCIVKFINQPSQQEVNNSNKQPSPWEPQKYEEEQWELPRVYPLTLVENAIIQFARTMLVRIRSSRQNFKNGIDKILRQRQSNLLARLHACLPTQNINNKLQISYNTSPPSLFASSPAPPTIPSAITSSVATNNNLTNFVAQGSSAMSSFQAISGNRGYGVISQFSVRLPESFQLSITETLELMCELNLINNNNNSSNNKEDNINSFTIITESKEQRRQQEPNNNKSRKNERESNYLFYHLLLPYSEATNGKEPRELILFWHAVQAYLQSVTLVLQHTPIEVKVPLPSSVYMLLLLFCQYHMAQSKWHESSGSVGYYASRSSLLLSNRVNSTDNSELSFSRHRNTSNSSTTINSVNTSIDVHAEPNMENNIISTTANNKNKMESNVDINTTNQRSNAPRSESYRGSETERFMIGSSVEPSTVSNDAVQQIINEEKEKADKKKNNNWNAIIGGGGGGGGNGYVRPPTYGRRRQQRPIRGRTVSNDTIDVNVNNDVTSTPNISPITTTAGMESENAENSAPQTIKERKRLPAAVRECLEANRITLNTILASKPSLLQSHFAFVLCEPTLLDLTFKLNEFRRRIIKRRQGRISLTINRTNCLRDSFVEIRKVNNLNGLLHIHFVNEEGADAGGLTREWFRLIGEEVINESYALFVHSHEAHTFQPNPFSNVDATHLQYFRFIGNVIGLAIIHNVPLDIHFTRAVYRHMIGIQPVFTDLESVDPSVFANLSWLLEHDANDLNLTFAVNYDRFGEMKEEELIPHGKTTAVTNANKRQYVRLLCEYYMTRRISEQLKELLVGLYSVVPREELQMFTEHELELVISGLPEIDIEDLRAHTNYEGYSQNSPQVRWFWEVVATMSKEDRANLLQFVTGSSKVPHGGFGSMNNNNNINIDAANSSTSRNGRGQYYFTINKWPGNSELLPQAHTCFNRVDLPEYPNAQTLREKLMLAITFGSMGFALV